MTRRRARAIPPPLLLLLAAALGSGPGGPAAAHDQALRTPSGATTLSTTPSLSRIRVAPDFTLPDDAGRLVRLSELRGRVVLLSFVYTRCTTACPLVTRRMALLQERLARDGAADRVAFVSVTVDPERDSPAALREYAARFGADRQRWRFLRDEPGRMAPVLAAWDEWARRGADGEVDHPARLYLIDERGDVREVYSLAFFDERQALLDIRALLREP